MVSSNVRSKVTFVQSTLVCAKEVVEPEAALLSFSSTGGMNPEMGFQGACGDPQQANLGWD